MTHAKFPFDDDWLGRDPKPSVPWAVARRRRNVRMAWLAAAILSVIAGSALAYLCAPAVGEIVVDLGVRDAQ